MKAGSAAITCVIPTHDRPDLLAESVASVLRQQTDQQIELVVIDDAGSQGSRDVVDAAARHASAQVSYVVRSGPNGASASRNLGGSVASGDLLAFLDDDDYWDPHFLDQAVGALASSGADMAVSWLNVLDLDGTVSPLARMPEGLTAADAAARNLGFTGSNFLIRRSVFEALGGFDPELPVSNDKDFLLRFLLVGYRYVVIPEFLVTHRRHDGPQLTAGNERRAAGVEAYMRKHKSVLGLRDRWHLYNKIHRIRLRTATTYRMKLYHAMGFAITLSGADIKSKWRRRGGRYSDIR